MTRRILSPALLVAALLLADAAPAQPNGATLYEGRPVGATGRSPLQKIGQPPGCGQMVRIQNPSAH